MRPDDYTCTDHGTSRKHIEPMKVAGEYREDKRSFVASTDGEHFSLSIRTALAPAARIPYRFDNVIVCLTNVGEIRFTTDTPGVSVRHTAGDILLLPAGRPLYTDYIAPTATRPLECLTLELDRCLIDACLRDLPLEWPDHESVAELYSIDDVSEFVSLGAGAAIRRLHVLLGDGEVLVARERLIDAVNQELIVLLLQSRARVALVTEQRGRGTRVARLVDYIRTHVRDDLSVTTLARICHLSPSSLHAHCRASFGTTPAALVRETRVRVACELLRANPDAAVKTIAREAGFVSAAQFTQTFKAATGLTPSAFRAEQPPAASP